MTDEIKCTKVVARNGGRDEQGRPIVYHEKCGRPASEVEIGGLLTKAKAVLCERHKIMADRDSFVSANGFSKGKINPKAKKDGYSQPRLEGTGIIDKPTSSPEKVSK